MCFLGGRPLRQECRRSAAARRDTRACLLWLSFERVSRDHPVRPAGSWLMTLTWARWTGLVRSSRRLKGAESTELPLPPRPGSGNDLVGGQSL
jgi:hypothetical protein